MVATCDQGTACNNTDISSDPAMQIFYEQGLMVYVVSTTSLIMLEHCKYIDVPSSLKTSSLVVY